MMSDAKYQAVAYIEKKGAPVLKGCVRGELYYNPDNCSKCQLLVDGECQLQVVDNRASPDMPKSGFWTDGFLDLTGR